MSMANVTSHRILQVGKAVGERVATVAGLASPANFVVPITFE